jgi:hypothetical protein
MPASSDNGQAPARSAVCVTSPPHLTDDDREWFIPELGRGARRALRPGEHVAADHPLVVQYPGFFQPSSEPVDCWPQGVLTQEAAKRQQAEQMRLASRPARRVTPCCIRCGQEHDQSVILLDQPTQLALISALSAVEDGDSEAWADRHRIEAQFSAMAKASKDQQDELVRIEAEFRASHPSCPEGTEPMPEPDVPDRVPLQWRLPGVRTLG